MKLSSLVCSALLLATSLYALAFDCTQASNDSEVAICGYDDLLALNHTMETTFQTLRDRLNYDNFIALRSEQKRWLEARDLACGIKIDCLTEHFDARQVQLTNYLNEHADEDAEGYTREQQFQMTLDLMTTIVRLVAPKEISQAVLSPDAMHYRLNLRTFKSSIGNEIKERCELFPVSFFENVDIKGNTMRVSRGDVTWIFTVVGPRRITIDRLTKDFALKREAELAVYYDTQNRDWRSAKIYIPLPAYCAE